MKRVKGGRLSRFAVILFACAAAVVFGVNGSCSNAGTHWNQEQLQALVDDWRTNSAIPGVVVGISLPGQKDAFVTSGVSDTAAGTPTKTDDRFQIASISKTFIAAETLRLSGAGKLVLDSPVSAYLSGVPFGDKVTVRYLLNHRSGYFDPIYDDPEFISSVARSLDRKWTWEETLKSTFQHELFFEPGTAYRYSNANYLLLGQIIEHVTGQHLSDLLTTDFITRFHLVNTLVATPDYSFAQTKLVHGYTVFPLTGKIVDITTFPSTALFSVTTDTIISTAPDLLRWARALYGAEPEALSPKLQSEMLTFEEEGPYGLGVVVSETSVGRSFGHGGSTAGYVSLMNYFPQQDMAIVILANADSPSGNLEELLSSLLDQMFPSSSSANIDQWVADLSSKDPQTRKQAISNLGHSGVAAAKAVPALVVILTNDDSADNRVEAALALGMVGTDSSEAREALQKALQDPSPSVRDAAKVALEFLTK